MKMIVYMVKLTATSLLVIRALLLDIVGYIPASDLTNALMQTVRRHSHAGRP